MATELPPGIVPGATLRGILLIKDQQWLDQLVQRGWIPKVGRDQYPLVGAIQGFIKYRDDRESRIEKPKSSARVQEARAAGLEADNARKAGLMMPVAEVKSVVFEIFGGLKAALDGLAARCTRDMELRRKIETAVNDILDRAADRIEQMGLALRTRDASSPAAEVDA